MPIAGGHADGDQGQGVVGQVLGLEVGQHEGDGHRVAGGLGDPQADAAQDVAPVIPQDLGDRVLDDLAAGLDLFEHRGLGHLGADDQADDDQHDGQQERHPPGPGAGQVHGDQEDQVGQQQADREAGLHDAGVLALGAPGGVFVGHQDGAAPFGAVGQALHDADQDQQDAGPDAHALVGREQADAERGDTHQHQAGDQNRFAADLVAQIAADHAAERADREADAQGGEGQQGAGQRITGGKEVVAEVQRRRGAVADEVVGLDGGPDARADGHLPGAGGGVRRCLPGRASGTAGYSPSRLHSRSSEGPGLR